jgi:hypothetical protein
MSSNRYLFGISLILSLTLTSCGGGGEGSFTDSTGACAQVAGTWKVADSAHISCTGSFGSGSTDQSATGTISITQNGCEISFLSPSNTLRTGTVTATTMQVSGPLALASDGVTFTQNGIDFSGPVSVDGSTVNLSGTGVASGTALGVPGSCTATSTETLTR